MSMRLILAGRAPTARNPPHPRVEIPCRRRDALAPPPRSAYPGATCRNIVPLHNFAPPATDAECHDAALQFVRKIVGTTKPSRANQDVFDRAVAEIAASVRHLLDDLVTNAPPKIREEEAAKRQARSAERYEAIRVFQEQKRAGRAG